MQFDDEMDDAILIVNIIVWLILREEIEHLDEGLVETLYEMDDDNELLDIMDELTLEAGVRDEVDDELDERDHP